MRKLAFVLLSMACTCRGREVRSSSLWVGETSPSSDFFREDEVSSQVVPTSTLHPLKALATLFVAFNPRAAFNPGTTFAPGLHRAAVGRRSGDLRLQGGQQYEQDPFEEELPPDVQARIDEQTKWDERAKAVGEMIKGVPIFFVGMGRRKDLIASYMGQRYFWGQKTIVDVPKMTLQWFPEVQPGFRYADSMKPNITECLNNATDLVELIHKEVLRTSENAKDHIVICGDSTGDDEDWEIMRKQNGITVQVVWECDPDAYDDVWLPKKDKYEFYNKWNASHYKGADIVLDIRWDNEELSKLNALDPSLEDVWRPDLHGYNLVQKIAEHMERKKAFGPNAPLVAQLQMLKKSELRKRAIAEGVDEEKLEEADDADDPNAALVNFIIEKIGIERIVTDEGKITKEELEGLKKSELRKKAEAAGATTEAIDTADDSDDPKEAFIQLILDLDK